MKLWRILSVCVLMLCCGSVLASQINRNSGLGIGRTGPTTARGTVTPTGGTFGELLNRPANLSGGKSDFERLSEMPFKLPDIPPDKAKVKGVLTPANIGKALRGGVGGYLAGEAFKRLAEEACVRLMGGHMQLTESGAWEECVPGAPPLKSDGYEYFGHPNTGWHSSKEQSCNGPDSPGTPSNFGKHNWRYLPSTGGDYGSCAVDLWSYNGAGQPVAYVTNGTGAFVQRRSSGCAAGKYVWSDGTCHTEPQVVDVTYRPITTDQAQQKLEDAIKLPGNASKVWDAMRDYADKGGQFDMDQPLAVEGPAQSPSSVTTSQTTSNGQTLTTTNTTVINYTYAGDTITVNQITNSVTRNSAGEVVSSTTTSGPPKETDEAPVDSPLPPVPDLYTRKYPQGMEGIYDEYKDQFKNTSLVQLASQLMPNVGDGGTCPSWPMNFNLASWAAYGVHDVAPPCWIWGVAKAILILSALLLARALIFGG
ncbi:hypothetical protein J2W32_001178 [Variovorax boronicumulans]|uniref:Uncharacterized protein n=1 Tax=Variovorax boronicumulans TaxID=436515 RepID=A0AAW8CLW9_9BURK|nr:hypothetical protein [Variovorax boronicumulans]MDP9892378.1 hypothetical protein [Variovorax boronicumulans]MDQ0052142.1 hypothetical protein [Variovorax boronicumulans]